MFNYKISMHVPSPLISLNMAIAIIWQILKGRFLHNKAAEFIIEPNHFIVMLCGELKQ